MKKFMSKPGEKERQREYQKKRPYDKEKARLKTNKWRSENRVIVRAQNRRARYKISDVQHLEMLIKQNHLCAICGGPPRVKPFLVMDHCHETGKIRGLLCQPCNVGIGHLGEDIARLEAAITYLRSHSAPDEHQSLQTTQEQLPPAYTPAIQTPGPVVVVDE